MPIGEFGVLCHRHTAVVVVITQCHVDRCDGAQLFEESKEMRESFRNIEQVPGDNNPIGAKFSHGFDDTIMPRMISIQMQIRKMDGSTTSKGRMDVGEAGHVMIGQAPFPMRYEAECSIKRFAYAIPDERSRAIRP